MRQTVKFIPTLALLLFFAGCTTLYQSTVTLTSVTDSAMKMWARLSADGVTTPALDTKVIATHNEYRKACGVAKAALITYKDTGDKTAYERAFATAQVLASGLVELIVPLVTTEQAETLKTNLKKANVP